MSLRLLLPSSSNSLIPFENASSQNENSLPKVSVLFFFLKKSIVIKKILFITKNYKKNCNVFLYIKNTIATSTSDVEDSGIGTSNSQLQMSLARSDLASTLTCRVSSLALTDPLTVDVKLDIHGKATKKKINTFVCTHTLFSFCDEQQLTFTSPPRISLEKHKFPFKKNIYIYFLHAQFAPRRWS